MIKIGYLGAEAYSPNGALELLEEVQPTNIGLLGGTLTRCPSVRGYHMNTFEVKCPFDLEWTVFRTDEGTESRVTPISGPAGFRYEINSKVSTVNIARGYKPFDFDPQGLNCQIRIRPEWSFVSDTPNTIMIQHSNGIDTNPQIISGMLDIYKWPDRGMNVGYAIEGKEKTFRLKSGEPWYRVTFITPDLEPVKLVRMNYRPDFLLKTRNKTSLSAIQFLNWRKVFNNFGKTRPKKLINA